MRTLVLAKCPIWTNCVSFRFWWSLFNRRCRRDKSFVISLCFLVLLACLICAAHGQKEKDEKKRGLGGAKAPPDFQTDEEKWRKKGRKWGRFGRDKNQEKYTYVYIHIYIIVHLSLPSSPTSLLCFLLLLFLRLLFMFQFRGCCCRDNCCCYDLVVDLFL